MTRTRNGWIPSKLIDVEQSRDSGGDGCVDDMHGILDSSLTDLEVVVEVPMDAQQAVDHEAESWGEVWQQGVLGIGPKWPTEMLHDLPALHVAELREACGCFPGAVGLGWDKFHPRAIARCSDLVLSLLLALAFRF